MQRFEVLSRSQNIHQNYLLEASAGTGKTFSIENIVVRLLIEDPHFSLEEILVVTFTRAATRDLKQRIRENIQKAKKHLEFADECSPDYIKSVIEQGEKERFLALRRLERALLAFDRAQIFTIHSFCSQMLNSFVFEGNLRLDTVNVDDPFSRTEMLKVIHDFFRTKISEETYTSGQIKLVLNAFNNDLSKLENTLLSLISTGIDIEKQLSLKEELEHFNQVMSDLKSAFQLSSKSILNDFSLLAPCYNKICDRQRNVKAEVIDKVEAFAALFDRDQWGTKELDQLIEDQLFLVKILSSENQKAKAELPQKNALHYPELTTILKDALESFVSSNAVFARMAYDCQQLFRSYQEKEEKYGFDDILKTMNRALCRPEFVKQVQNKYAIAIVDEFQDTDPVQWDIFHRLFLQEGKFLYLVGDPKQSIYAFRQADIYTYLDAASCIGKGNQASLAVNYRSQPSLVEALNALFAESASPGLFALPRLKRTMSYPEVDFAPISNEKEFSDNRGSVHFFIAEDLNATQLSMEKLEKEYFLPFIVQEIQRLARQEDMSLQKMAILVADRYQAFRVMDFLALWNIPAVTQRSESLADSVVLTAFREFLKAVGNPRHESSLKTALGGKFIRWTHRQVRELEDPKKLEGVLMQFSSLQMTFKQHGLAKFFQEFMQSKWHEDSLSTLERILSQEGGEDFFQDVQQIFEILLEHESRGWFSLDSMIRFLDDFPTLSLNDDERIKKVTDPSKQAVNILTLHASKGLEYDIVFTLGLIKRSKASELLIPTVDDGKRQLIPVVHHDQEEYQEHCMELDAEKMRQLYVGMTRAKYRLYNPVAILPKAIKVDVGCASPMELFLAHLGANSEALYDRIRGNDGTTLIQFLDQFPENIKIAYTLLNQTPVTLEQLTTHHRPDLSPPREVSVPGIEKFMHSFTSLSTPQHAENDRMQPPHDFFVVKKTPHNLPSGSETGTLLHEILENCPFSQVQQMNSPHELTSLVSPFLKDTPFAHWEKTICELIYNVLKTPLREGLCIADIVESHVCREWEFLHLSTYPKAPGYLKGFVDLIFEHSGKYYILDWKSNWLGPDLSYYDQQHIQQAMQEHDYYLQASLYRDALRRYLKLVDTRSFEELYGGVFYVFLRGVSNSSGVYYDCTC